MNRSTYTKEDIIDSLSKAGVRHGDIIFTHSNLGFFGKIENLRSMEEYCSIFFEAIFEVIGDAGTLVVPTFSYSFFNNEIFDVDKTPSKMGAFSEYVRLKPSSIRSIDPNFSVSAIGKNAIALTENVSNYSFGKESFFDRFHQMNGVICNLNFDSGSTFIHFVEKDLGVYYRYDKGFNGTIVHGGEEYEATFYHFVYSLDKPEDRANFVKFNQVCLDKGIVQMYKLGRGMISCISAKDTYDIIKEMLVENPRLLRY